MCVVFILLFFFFKQKAAYELRIRDWSSDVCASDLLQLRADAFQRQRHRLVEAFGAARIQVIGMRIDRPGVGVEETGERIGRIELVGRFGEVAVTLGQHLADLGRRLAGELEPQPVRSEEHTSELQSLMRNSSAVFCLQKNTNSK